jgi:hypothetical protein
MPVSRSRVYRLVDAGRLLPVMLARSRRVRWEDVLRLIEESTVGAEGGGNCVHEDLRT